MRPLIGESLGRMDIGLSRKNLVIPNELAHKLIIREIKGRAWLIPLNDVRVNPEELWG